jgi:hypothetical protein
MSKWSTAPRISSRLMLSCALAPLCIASHAFAQTHAVRNQDAVVRAVGVFEWTGPEAKPTASRLVPVTVFINGQLQDAGVYLARPVPFAIQTGTIFEVRKAGEDVGTLELAYDRHTVSSGQGSYDDGWIAVGAFKPAPKEPVVALKQKGPLAKIQVSGGSADSSRPHFGNQPAGSDAGAASKSTVDRSGAAGSGTTVSAQDDPDKPTLHRAGSVDSTRPADSSGDDPAADVDRPTLKRRTPDEVHSQAKTRNQASVSGGGDLNDDPDRPMLHRGKPVTRMEESDLPPLHGVPADMHQETAVSDAKDRPAHDFARSWESEAEHAAVLAQMQDAARTQLKSYGDGPVGNAAAPAKVVSATPAKPTATPAAHSSGQTAAQRRRKTAAAKAVSAVVSTPLLNESLRGYTLSYGGSATYVYMASASGSGGVPRYVTVVAQRDPLGALKVALTSVTDAAHLDRTPWYRLVDAVDAEASNRASLLFELRGQTSRAFALYRVIGAQAQQTFVSAAAE